MRNILIRSATVAVLALAAVGCKSGGMSGMDMKDTMTVATFDKDKDVTVDAPMDGTYMLVSTVTHGGPLETVTLKKGDKLGFMTMPDNTMMALAGDKTINIKDSKVMWVHGMAK